jgi:hypothetical protein
VDATKLGYRWESAAVVNVTPTKEKQENQRASVIGDSWITLSVTVNQDACCGEPKQRVQSKDFANRLPKKFGAKDGFFREGFSVFVFSAANSRLS